MSASKRRVNSTGRKRIERNHVEMEILPAASGEPLRAKAGLILNGYDFPASSSVVIEAYHRSSGMRFDCGTIENLSIPDPLVLTDIDRSGSVLFRLKVVDDILEPGKLLGSAERIKPKREQAGGENTRSIFPMEFRDLNHDIWKVEIEPDSGPVMIVNTSISGFLHQTRENPLALGILLSAALRFVLQEFVRGIERGEDEDEPGWKDVWFEYCKSILGIEDDPREYGEDEKRDWIDDTVNRFCEDGEFLNRIRQSGEDIL